MSINFVLLFILAYIVYIKRIKAHRQESVFLNPDTEVCTAMKASRYRGKWVSAFFTQKTTRKLPRSLVSSVKYHHKVKEVEPDNIHLTSVVHLADIICRKADIGDNGSEIIPHLQGEARDGLCVDEELIDEMIVELKEEEEKVKAFISSIK